MHIICATKTEAIPLIKALDLKHLAYKPFTIYQNLNHSLIISGIGMIKAAAATSYLLSQKKDAVCNIGYAAGKEVGELFYIHKIINHCNNKVFHLPKSPSLPNRACTTFALPQTTPSKTLADMEAAGIAEITKAFKQPLCVLKIVSDNFDPDSFLQDANLIERHLDVILSQIELQSAQNF